MCPEAEILSAYFDGEVPDPWKSRMEAHISTCPACRERLEAFSALRAPLAADAAAIQTAAGCKKAWNRIEADIQKIETRKRPSAFWGKSVRIPLPLVAAAILAITAAPVVTVASIGQPRGPRIAGIPPAPSSAVMAQTGVAQASVVGTGNGEFAVPADANFKDIESLVRFLDAQNLPVTINVQLPADRSYGYSGPPEIIKVSDAELKKGGK
jgi:anti-sigma factor RsiW